MTGTYSVSRYFENTKGQFPLLMWYDFISVAPRQEKEKDEEIALDALDLGKLRILFISCFYPLLQTPVCLMSAFHVLTQK